MNRLDILLPFGLPQEELAADLLRELKAPALAALVGLSDAAPAVAADGFARALPHELWLARRLGLDAGPDSSPPVAPAWMRRFGERGEGTWFVANPVHLHIARDHLVLTDRRQLGLGDEDAHDLFEQARPLFEDAGKTLRYGDAATWFVRADDWAELRTSTPDAACGHNIDIWLPQGSGEREWRKLQNEVQMLWHGHEINRHRGNPVNALWLWGGGNGAVPNLPYNAVLNPHGWLRGVAGNAALRVNGPGAMLSAGQETALLQLDDLTVPALSGDWSAWLAAYHQLETEWLAPLLKLTEAGELDELNLIVSGSARLQEFEFDRRARWKFWRKPSLARFKP